MPAMNMSVYISDELWDIYSKNKEELHNIAREALFKALNKLKKEVS